MSTYCKLCNSDFQGLKKWMIHLDTEKHKKNCRKDKSRRECTKCHRSQSSFNFLKKSPMTAHGIPRNEEYFKLCNNCRLNFKTKWKTPMYLRL